MRRVSAASYSDSGIPESLSKDLRLEARIGELLGPAPRGRQGGREVETTQHAELFHWQVRADFRVLAEAVRIEPGVAA
jgi:hypothetical protein